MPIRYSHSRLSAFENCPRQYRYRYIDKLPRPGPGIEAHVGICVHQALEFLHGERLQGRTAPGLPQVLEKYEQAWKATDPDTLRVVRQGFDAADYFQLGHHCLEAYYGSLQPFESDRTLAIEKKVEIKLGREGQYRLIGFIDRVERTEDGGYIIHDYKTSASRPRPQDLKADRQLALYEMGLRQELPAEEADASVKHVWHFLTFGETHSRTLDREALRAMARRIMSLIDRIAAAADYPARTGVLCHWCDFQEVCPEGEAYLEQQPPQGLPASRG